MTPVTGVMAPVATGGPHRLPTPPQFPLPQGFPNPFAIQQISLGAQPPQGPPSYPAGPQSQAQFPQPSQTAPQAPGLTLTTGPQGFMPGLGYFGVPGGQGFGPQAAVATPQAHPPTHFPGLQTAIQSPPAAAPGPAPAAQAGAPNPFWLNLAWQLTQTPAVRQALGERAEPLVTGHERLRTLGVALTCLAGPDLQEAFRALSAGSLDQTRFIDSFAEKLKAALGAAGMV